MAPRTEKPGTKRAAEGHEEAAVSQGWPGRKADPERHRDPDTKHRQSRGFGLVLETVRDGLDLAPGERRQTLARARMRTALLAIDAKYSRFKLGSFKDDPKKAARTVAEWESGINDPVFGIQHRYGICAGIWAGALQLIGLFYSHFRDAANKPENRDIDIALIKDTAQRLRALAEAVEKLADAMPTDPAAPMPAPLNQLRDNAHADVEGDRPIAERHKKFVREQMLDVYGFQTGRAGDPPGMPDLDRIRQGRSDPPPRAAAGKRSPSKKLR